MWVTKQLHETNLLLCFNTREEAAYSVVFVVNTRDIISEYLCLIYNGYSEQSCVGLIERAAKLITNIAYAGGTDSIPRPKFFVIVEPHFYVRP